VKVVACRQRETLPSGFALDGSRSDGVCLAASQGQRVPLRREGRLWLRYRERQGIWRPPAYTRGSPIGASGLNRRFCRDRISGEISRRQAAPPILEGPAGRFATNCHPQKQRGREAFRLAWLTNQVHLVSTGSNLAACHAFLIVEAQIAAMPKRLKPFQRAVRRSRNLTALILTDGAKAAECHVQDVSRHGAKIVVEMPSSVPNQFELAFSLTDNRRRCEVVWRRNKVLGVKFS
jgi:hypothetical protein